MSDLPQLAQLRAARVLALAEDDLRARILEESGALAYEARHLAQVLRELVALEHEKRPARGGQLALYNNKARHRPTDPDMLGAALLAGQRYQIKAWCATTPGGEAYLKATLAPAAPAAPAAT